MPPGLTIDPFLDFGMPYFGLISWQPFSQYTPPAADSGSGMGLSYGEIAVGFELLIHVGDQFSVLVRRQPLLYV